MGLQYASTIAVDERYLFFTLFVLAFLFAGGVLCAAVFLCVKYRAGSPANREGKVYSSKALEAGWISIALVLGLSVFVEKILVRGYFFSAF